MSRKAQLSMETIMIYGAVILVVTLAIGALIYFGVLDLGAMLPDKCDTGGKISCENFVVQNTAQGIQLEFINRVGKNIDNVKVTVAGVDDWESASYTKTKDFGGTVHNNGGTITVSDLGLSLANQQGKFKGRITIEYEVVGSNLKQKVTGELNAGIAQD